MKRTGIFGGSFNPVHIAHLILAERAAEAAGLDRVLFVPAGIAPHKPGNALAHTHHRLEMLRLATGDNPLFHVSDIEIKRKGTSFTLSTVIELEKDPGCGPEPTLILGADSVRDIHKWHRAGELLDRVRITGLKRPGVDTDDFSGNEKTFGPARAEMLRRCFITAPELGISASGIRRRAREGRSIRYLVPERVRKYILENGLFRVTR